MNTCTSPCPRTSLALFLAPHEPMCFTTCDGPHSGVPDDKRPPHRCDFGCDHDRMAHLWCNYGFNAEDVKMWSEAGIYCAAIAAECRTVGFDPSCEVDRRFLLSDDPETGRPFCDLLCDSETTAWQAWERWKAWL